MTEQERLDHFDKLKIHFLKKNNTGMITSLLFNIKFSFTDQIPTAATNGVEILFNPNFYDSISDEFKMTVLRHELDHVLRLHIIRMKDRDPEIWNMATDLIINTYLQRDKWVFDNPENACTLQNPIFKNLFNKGELDSLNEEEIYHRLKESQDSSPSSGGGSSSFGSPTLSDDLQQNVGNGNQEDTVTGNSQGPFTTNPSTGDIISKVQQAVIEGKRAGNNTADIEEYIQSTLEPIVPIEDLLVDYFRSLDPPDYTFKKPSRRGVESEFILPSLEEQEGRLENLMYFIDVSGSISSKEINTFLTELKYVFDEVKPEKMTVVQFDTTIKKVDVFHTDYDELSGLNIKGRGGTCLVDVRKYIEEHQPTAAVIFSDLYVEPMQPLDSDIPLVWIVVNNKDAKIKAGGDVFHINV